MTSIFEGIDGNWLELKLADDSKHYRCGHCDNICLALTHGYIICMTQDEFDRFGGEKDTCVWRGIDDKTLNPGVCPTCLEGCDDLEGNDEGAV